MAAHNFPAAAGCKDDSKKVGSLPEIENGWTGSPVIYFQDGDKSGEFQFPPNRFKSNGKIIPSLL